MDWVDLPYGCVGMVRTKDLGGSRVAWSWLILVPWAVNDVKPWIDGTEVLDGPLRSEEQQREDILSKMREVLDKRYGATVAQRAVDALIREVESGSGDL